MSLWNLLALGALASCGGAASGPAPQTPSGSEPAAEVGLDVAALQVDLEQAGAQGVEALEDRIRALDPDYDQADPVYGEIANLCEGQPTRFGSVERLEGQLDDDPEPETVLQVVVNRSAYENGNEECAEFWIGLFDGGPGGARLAGSLHRIQFHCNFDDTELGFTLGFLGDAPGPEAGLWVQTQESTACGTLVDYTWRRVSVRLGASRDLETGELPATARPMAYERSGEIYTEGE